MEGLLETTDLSYVPIYLNYSSSDPLIHVLLTKRHERVGIRFIQEKARWIAKIKATWMERDTTGRVES
jgi:hypothetical protein